MLLYRLIPKRRLATFLASLLALFLVWRLADTYSHEDHEPDIIPERPKILDFDLAKVVSEIDTVDVRALTSQINNIQINYIDFMNGELDKTDVFGGSLQGILFDATTSMIKNFQYAFIVQNQTYDRKDFNEMGRRSRALLIIYKMLHDESKTMTPYSATTLQNIINNLSRVLYPWLTDTIRNMHNKFIQSDSTGIVITTGEWHFELSVHLIQTIRIVLSCTLPIEVHYAGDGDLSPDRRKALHAMSVKTVNVHDYFGEESRNIGGWSIKPFAILASSFTRVIFVDADALFFQDPRGLVESSLIFKKFGQVFYHDRSIDKGHDAEWFLSYVPTPSLQAKKYRKLNKLSFHEMESGVVVMDKGRTGVLLGLLAVCKMNSKFERDEVTYKHMHGDKETFWMAFEMLRVPYKFSPSYGGTVGYKNETTGRICGGLFHMDEYLKPLWWNGGVIANKHSSKDKTFLEFEYIAYDSYGYDIIWDWETPVTPFCLGPKDPANEIIEISAADKEKAAKYVDLYKEIKQGDWKAYFTKNFNVEF